VEIEQGRERYPEEARLPWLTILLDSFHLFESGCARELAAAETARGAKIACRPGCWACCSRPSVPMTELEIMGVSWYVLCILRGERRDGVVEQLKHHRERNQCPFLLRGECAVYPVRPFACRFLYVFGLPCTPEEIPVESRPRDIWVPGPPVVRPAIFEMLAYFGFTRPEDKEAAFAGGYIPAASRLMSDLAWEALPFDAPLP
jgi:uncharacterized protein